MSQCTLGGLYSSTKLNQWSKSRCCVLAAVAFVDLEREEDSYTHHRKPGAEFAARIKIFWVIYMECILFVTVILQVAWVWSSRAGSGPHIDLLMQHLRPGLGQSAWARNLLRRRHWLISHGRGQRWEEMGGDQALPPQAQINSSASSENRITVLSIPFGELSSSFRYSSSSNCVVGSGYSSLVSAHLYFCGFRVKGLAYSQPWIWDQVQCHYQ